MAQWSNETKKINHQSSKENITIPHHSTCRDTCYEILDASTNQDTNAFIKQPHNIDETISNYPSISQNNQPQEQLIHDQSAESSHTNQINEAKSQQHFHVHDPNRLRENLFIELVITNNTNTLQNISSTENASNIN